jgi:pyrophosphate--fructose-6-phosphate 1-phosphotransferase
VEFGDSSTTIDSKCADIIAQAFPHIFGQKLVRFLEPNTTASESDAQVIQEHPPIRLDLNSELHAMMTQL